METSSYYKREKITVQTNATHTQQCLRLYLDSPGRCCHGPSPFPADPFTVSVCTILTSSAEPGPVWRPALSLLESTLLTCTISWWYLGICVLVWTALNQ